MVSVTNNDHLGKNQKVLNRSGFGLICWSWSGSPFKIVTEFVLKAEGLNVFLKCCIYLMEIICSDLQPLNNLTTGGEPKRPTFGGKRGLEGYAEV